jgi:hypothetical protein
VGYSGLLVEDAADAGRKDLAGELEELRAGGMELLRHVDGLLAESRLDAMAEVRPEEIARELRSASLEPLRRIVAGAERLVRESGSRAEPASLAEDLGKVRDCARQFEALVSRLAQAPPGAAP